MFSHGGKAFEGSVMKDISTKYGVNQKLTSPYQWNRLTERTIYIVSDKLTKSLSNVESKTSLDKMIEFSDRIFSISNFPEWNHHLK